MNIIDDPLNKTITIEGMKFSYEFFFSFLCPDPRGLYIFKKEADGTTTVTLSSWKHPEDKDGSKDPRT